MITEKRKRGRPPLGRKAMTAAQRQARHRQRVKKAAKQRAEQHRYQPPHGYAKAKERLLADGHHFERARREFGFEEGTFVDGAYLGSSEVVALADLGPGERKQWLATRRQERKDDACVAVEGYMMALQVSLDELAAYVRRARAGETFL